MIRNSGCTVWPLLKSTHAQGCTHAYKLAYTHSPFLKKLFVLFCMDKYFTAYIYMFTTCMCGAVDPTKLELQTGVSLPCEFWELHPGSLDQQPALLTSEQFLQSCTVALKCTQDTCTLRCTQLHNKSTFFKYLDMSTAKKKFVFNFN